MCGIVAAFDKEANVNNDVLLQFEDQSSRGTNGFGSIFFDETGAYDIDRSTGQIKAIIDVKLREAKQLIFHHRQPSSSKNKISQTHPIWIDSGTLKHKYIIVHNGVIYNSDEIREYHEEELGYNYSTLKDDVGYGGQVEKMYNDSEVLGYEIARFIEGQSKHIQSAGSAAFIIVQVDKKSDKIIKIFFGRNSRNPLNMASNGRTRITLSSEGKGANIKEDMIYSFTPNNYKISKKKMLIPTSIPMTKEEEDKAKEEEAKSKGTTVEPAKDLTENLLPSKTGGYSYDDWDSYKRYDDDGSDAPKKTTSIHNPGIMAEEDAEDVEELLDQARLEIDGLADAINDSYSGEELYLIDTIDSVKHIATCLAQAVDRAQRAATTHLANIHKEEVGFKTNN